MEKFFKILLIIGLLLVAFVACMNMDIKKVDAVNNTVKTVVSDALPQHTIETIQDVELTAGNYVAGTDFKAGVYTIRAIEGKGLVNSNNLFEGGVCAMLGVAGSPDEYIIETKNISLPNKMSFTVTGNLRVKMIYIRSK
jgi:hypothetical protein